jgi:pilus assembly protein CpaF
MSTLILAVDGPNGSRAIPLGSGAITIGASPEVTVRLDGPGIARCHAEFVRDAATQRYFVQDLGTAQGTWVNGERVVHYGPIVERDLVRIGGYTLRLRAGATPRHAGAVDWRRCESAPRKPQRRAANSPQQASRSSVASRAHQTLIERLDLRRRDIGALREADLRAQAAELLDVILADSAPGGESKAELKQFVLDEALGLGPLEPLLRDDSVSEIMVNSEGELFVERAGRLERSPQQFSGARALHGVIERIVAGVGRRIDESSPMVDARLTDGSRVNVVIPPIAVSGPAITIRKFARRQMSPADLVASGSLSPEMMDFLAICVHERRNIIVSGGTGAGKTTLLNVLSQLIPADERIVTIEDAAELRLEQANLVSLEARPRNAEGRGAVTIRDLVRNALRMRPDRIVVGECRGGEALDMLQAMNTGHDGSLTTAHANGPRDALARLEVMVLMAGVDLPVAAIREQIASAVHVVVQQTRFSCGTRKVTHIVEVTGTEGGKLQTQDVFRYFQTGRCAAGKVTGYFDGCGYVPSFYEQLDREGIALERGIFARTQGGPT